MKAGETAAAVLGIALIGGGVWWAVRKSAVPLIPPPDVEDDEGLDLFAACAALTAVQMQAGVTCTALLLAKKLWDKIAAGNCSTKAPADLADRVITNNGLNGACAYAVKGKELWCAEAYAGRVEHDWMMGRTGFTAGSPTQGGTGSRNPDRREEQAGTPRDDFDPTGWLAKLTPGAAYVGVGKSTPPGYTCLAYRNGCVPLTGYPSAWGKCAKGTRALRGGDAGTSSPTPGDSKERSTGKTFFELWIGAHASAYLRGTVVDHRTK